MKNVFKMPGIIEFTMKYQSFGIDISTQVLLVGIRPF